MTLEALAQHAASASATHSIDAQLAHVLLSVVYTAVILVQMLSG